MNKQQKPCTQPFCFHPKIASTLHLQPISGKKRLGLLFPLLAPTRLFSLAVFFSYYYSNFVNTSSPHPFLVRSPTQWVHVTGRGEASSAALPGAAPKCP